MTSTLALQEYLRERREMVDAALERLLLSTTWPGIIAEAMRYSLLAGGKRFRPMLTLAAAETIAANPRLQRPAGPALSPEAAIQLAMPAACAVEFIHTYSLIHDDLPAMDDDTLRRGRPTSHVVYGEGMAILAGDGLLTEAFGLLARMGSDAASAGSPDVASDGAFDARRVCRTIAVVAEAAGAAGMVGGQAIDLKSEGGSANFTLDALRDMHARKTGALIRAAAATGAIMAGATDAAVHAIDQYAASLGLAFQIVDDILDVEGATEDLGKTAGKDAAAFKPTYPALLGLERSRLLAQEALTDALAALTRAGIASSRLEEIARWVVDRTN